MPKNIHVVNLSSHDQLPPETPPEKDEFEQVKEAVEKEEEEQQPEIIEEPKPKPKTALDLKTEYERLRALSEPNRKPAPERYIDQLEKDAFVTHWGRKPTEEEKKR